MRYFCLVVLLAWTVGSADVFVADQQQSAGGIKGTKPREQPLADIPEAFRFLLYSFEQFAREYDKRPTFLDDLWKGLPYDSISLERGGTGGCVGACPTTTVTLYRATVSGIRPAAPCRTAPCPSGGEPRGRAELHIVEGVSAALPGLPGASLQPPETLGTRATRISEGSVRIHEFANLSYLLHRARFFDLPNEYACIGCPADRAYVVLSVVAAGKTKTVIDYGVERPVELWGIQQAIDSVSKSIQWTPK
jgi:hypothetical protein